MLRSARAAAARRRLAASPSANWNQPDAPIDRDAARRLAAIDCLSDKNRARVNEIGLADFCKTKRESYVRAKQRAGVKGSTGKPQRAAAVAAMHAAAAKPATVEVY